ncbi:MAG: hypothetical protein H0Z40_04300 [Desulfotomaculum sp.]|nr:hypothetical protein [Desulfotomaculum sp.]
MEKITMNLQPDVDKYDIHRLQQALHDMGHSDELTVTLESADAHQADPIINLLNENGFDHQIKGSHDGKSIYIHARRKPH